MRKLIFTLSAVNAVLNLMVIGIFMPDEVITLYGPAGLAQLHGSKWFYLIYAAIPLVISGVFRLTEIINNKSDGGSAGEPEEEPDGSETSAVDEFLSGRSRKSDNADMLCTWFFAVISWVMTGLALNKIENIGVIMPSIIVVMLSAFIIFASSLYGGGDKAVICGIEVKWLEGNAQALKRSKRISTMLGVMAGMVGVCLAAWSLVVNNNIPNCIAVIELLFIAFLTPLLYSYSASKKRSKE